MAGTYLRTGLVSRAAPQSLLWLLSSSLIGQPCAVGWEGFPDSHIKKSISASTAFPSFPFLLQASSSSTPRFYATHREAASGRPLRRRAWFRQLPDVSPAYEKFGVILNLTTCVARPAWDDRVCP